MIVALSIAAAVAGAPMSCSLPSGWDSIEAKRARFLVFGELHGTGESPELVGTVACALAEKGHRVLVGVELDASSNEKLQQLWSTQSQGFAQRIVKDLPGFAERQDGVGSEAMLAMLDRLHTLSRSGKKIDILAFNSDPAEEKKWAELPGQGPHEAGQAANIAAAAAGKHYDDVLVLVGNLHARKQPVDDQGVMFKPMAMHLASAGSVLSLNEIFATGTAWNCILKPSANPKPGEQIADSDVDCGAHKIGGGAPRPATQLGLWFAGQPKKDSAYDGYFWFPVVNGSPPAGKGAGD